jgi:mono/diheme cytochrome c family protein
VSVRQSRTKLVAPLLGLAALGIGLAVLPGCEMQGYSEDMTYPLRSDLADPSAIPIVWQAPSADPRGFERPGQWAFMQPVFDETNGIKFDATKLTTEQQSGLRKWLDDHFGKPAKPTVKGIDDEARASLFLAKSEAQLNEQLAQGSVLYRRHCLHCHGLTGDGHGPTAPWVNPHPRDYRAGMFKFTSTLGGKSRKPTRADLIRTLKQGVEGTSMPTFGLLPQDELEALVSYVMHLSIRGQVEYVLIATAFAEASDPSKMSASAFKDSVLDTADSTLQDRVREWMEAEKTPIPVAKFPVASGDMSSKEGQESIKRGYQLFLGLGVNTASCMSCHQDYGRQLTYKYDNWGSVVRPRDMTAGVFRGGRRPLDIYYRIFNGVNGTPMPAFADPNDKEIQQKMQQVWDLANFIQAVPYPAMLPEDVRQQVYPPEKTGSAHVDATRRQ